MTAIDPESLFNAWCDELARIAPDDRFARDTSNYPPEDRRLIIEAMAAALARVGAAR